MLSRKYATMLRPSARVLFVWTVAGAIGISVLVHGPVRAGSPRVFGGYHSHLSATIANVLMVAIGGYLLYDLVMDMLYGGALVVVGSRRRVTIELPGCEIAELGAVKLASREGLLVSISCPAALSEVVPLTATLSCADRTAGSGGTKVARAFELPTRGGRSTATFTLLPPRAGGTWIVSLTNGSHGTSIHVQVEWWHTLALKAPGR